MILADIQDPLRAFPVLAGATDRDRDPVSGREMAPAEIPDRYPAPYRQMLEASATTASAKMSRKPPYAAAWEPYQGQKVAYFSEEDIAKVDLPVTRPATPASRGKRIPHEPVPPHGLGGTERVAPSAV